MQQPAIKLEQLVARAQQLCSLPTVAMKVLDLTSNPQVDARALKECIEIDPALTSKILRIVNSSLFGLTREISSLNQALALLGNQPLKMLVLGFSLPSELFDGLSGDVVGRYWRRSLTKAVAARAISETVWKLPGDEAFVVALLQDVGMLLLIQELHDPYVVFLDRIQKTDADLLQAEVRSLGFSHIQLSARLLSQWGLPETLVESVGWDPSQQDLPLLSPGSQTLVQIVHLAELTARLMLDGRPGVLGTLIDNGQRYHHLTESQLESVLARLEERVQQLADVLSLQLPPGLDYRDVLARSQAQLADLAATTAGQMVRHAVLHGVSADDETVLKQIQDLSRAAESPLGALRPTRRLSSPPPAVEAPVRYTAAMAEPATAVDEPSVFRRAAVEADLLEVLNHEVGACRRDRCALSLLLVDLGEYDRLAQTRGVECADRARWLVEALCERLGHPGQTCVAHGPSGFAITLPDCDRRQVVELGNQLLTDARNLETSRSGRNDQPFTLSIGAATVAMPPKNFPARDLVGAADRCLYGSHASGGNIVKSIEIY